MYVGRDMTELGMVPKSEWTEKELAYFHHSLQQVVPYLNAEGVSIHNEIVKEIMSRDCFHKEAGDNSGTRIHYD